VFTLDLVNGLFHSEHFAHLFWLATYRFIYNI
jgi:hypothetical protein